MSSHEANSPAQQNSDNVLGLLRVFLDKHHLGLEELAGLLRITPQTLEEWFQRRNGTTRILSRPCNPLRHQKANGRMSTG